MPKNIKIVYQEMLDKSFLQIIMAGALLCSYWYLQTEEPKSYQ